MKIDLDKLNLKTFNIMKTKKMRERFSGSNNPMSKDNPDSESRRKSVSEKLKDRPSKLKGRTYEEIHGEEKAKEINDNKSQLFKERFIINEFQNLLDYFKIDLVDEKFEGSHFKHTWKCKECSHEFFQIWNAIQQGFRCPTCHPRFMGDSQSERELREFVKSLGIDIIENDRKIISPKELDIIIPSHNLAIEHNGTFFHSEIYKPKYYHLNKTKACEKIGIRLLHYFEDEWIQKKDLIKNMLTYTLNLSNSPRINARDCIIKTIDQNVSDEFLDTYHIQGKTIGDRIKLGAFHNNKLVSLMTFRSNNKIGLESEWMLNRFCSDYNFIIPGVASKLLSHFKNNYSWDKIITYAERRLSDGDLYKKLGFSFIKYTDVNFWYTNGGLIREDRRFVIHKMKKEEIKNGITQDQFMAAKGYFKIYGCGNLRFELLK